MGIYLPGTGTLGCVVWPGAGITHPQDIPPNFYLPHMNVGPPVPVLLLPPSLCATLYLLTSLSAPASPSFLPIWMNVSSLSPWLWEFHTAQFSDSSGYLF